MEHTTIGLSLQQYINRLIIYAAAVYLANGRTTVEASVTACTLWNDTAADKDNLAD